MTIKGTDFKKGKYRHYKGQYYRVIDLVRHSETDEFLVLYQPLYGEGALWVRPYNMFFETIEQEGEMRQRFEYVSE